MTTRKIIYTFNFRLYPHTQRMFVITTYSHKTRELNNLCHICEICHKFREALLQTKVAPSFDFFRTLFIQSIIYTNERRGDALGTIIFDPTGWTQIFLCKHCI
jgi:hypothetical protein